MGESQLDRTEKHIRYYQGLLDTRLHRAANEPHLAHIWQPEIDELREILGRLRRDEKNLRLYGEVDP